MDAPGPSCQPRLPAKLWKLGKTQIRNTLAAFAPGTEDLAGAFGSASDGGFGAFSNKDERLDLSLPVLTAMAEVAPRVGEAAVAALPSVCTSGMKEADCTGATIRTLINRAFRRPGTPAEIEEFTAFYLQEVAFMPASEAWAQVAAALVMAPEFLFRSELGAPTDDSGTKLTPYETAMRLSYGLTDGPPDDELAAAAANGDLDDPEKRESHARRLLAQPASATARLAFFNELVPYVGARQAVKDVEAFADFTSELADSMVTAAERRITDVLQSDEPRWQTLFSNEEGYVDARLAKFYGMKQASNEWQRRALPPERRGGLLAEPALLAALSERSQTGAVHRGHFVSSQLLCIELPAAPKGVPPLPSESAASPLMRDRLAIHSKNEFCARCHQYMDPAGLVLESFDAVGQYRMQQQGRTIDPRSTVMLSEGKTADVKDVAELSQLIATAPEATACFVKQQARWALGRDISDEGRCYLDKLTAEFGQTGGNLNDLLVHLMVDDEMMLRAR